MCIENHLQTYVMVESKQEKTLIVAKIVENIQECSARSGGYGFVKKEILSSRWVVVDDKVARDKVGQALRDLIKAAKRRSRRYEVQKCKKQLISKQMKPCCSTSKVGLMADILPFQHLRCNQDESNYKSSMQIIPCDETPSMRTPLRYEVESAHETKSEIDSRISHECSWPRMLDGSFNNLDCIGEIPQEHQQVQSMNNAPYNTCCCPPDHLQLVCRGGESAKRSNQSDSMIPPVHDVGCDDFLSPSASMASTLEFNTLQNYNHGQRTEWRRKSYASRSA